MSKSKGIFALLGALVFCVPAIAGTTISDTGIEIRLRGLPQIAPNSYELDVGTLALLQVRAHAGDMVLVYAVPLDAAGNPDSSAMVFLVLPEPVDANGNCLRFFTVPAAAAGMSFQVQAITWNPVDLFDTSPALTIAIRA